MTVAILVPVLWRPGRVAALLENIETATPEPHRTLFISEPDDHEELAALDAAGADYIAPGPRTYAHKINLGYDATDEPYLFLAADDLNFHSGWLAQALGHLEDGVGVVGTNDGGCNPRVRRGHHSVHSLVTRGYIERHGGTIDGAGKVLHDGYEHAYCDDELVHTAKARNAYRHAHRSVVEHLHPFARKARQDDVYRLGQSSVLRDQSVYEGRKHLWETSR